LRLEDYVAGVKDGDRAVLGRAITLLESRRADHRVLAQELLTRLLPATGGGQRIGVTGVPGAGKSTLIERLGLRLIEDGKRVAVLAVDPSSSRSRGSILGDKTRMGELARQERAFIRPSPTGGALGGVAAATRETILLLEAAGFDVVLVETVGVGQSEILVAGMVDSLLLLLLAGAGDELQGIKRGILELADVVAINKADGANLMAAREARAQLAAALRFLPPQSRHWQPPVLAVSAADGSGLAELWAALDDHHRTLAAHGELAAKRRRQARDHLWSLLDDGLHRAFRQHPAVAARLRDVERRVEGGELTPRQAAEQLLDAFGRPSS